MNVLLTNDDGVFSEGMRALVMGAPPEVVLTIVAPSDERSACSHAVTIGGDMQVRECSIGDRPAFSVDGTSADCVKIAVACLCATRPDLVIAGVNGGLNTGIHTLYSGTVSAAMEASVLAIPALAISVDAAREDSFDLAARVAWEVGRSVVCDSNMVPGTMLNVNVPGLSAQELRGFRVTRQGPTRVRESYDIVERQGDSRIYRMQGGGWSGALQEDSDEVAVRSGYISLTPLHVDRTDDQTVTRLQASSTMLEQLILGTLR